ncbi:hypothetical protein GUA87_15395 [Sneathiella sp. P13V-1]|uniref:hypothetical protein n=1 Tax=Sneathiella sp. P13V-1 TaxID=2697366 RepID=UPI00187B9B0F|nr:hypothetical protein [Sneathiella sp. P13V-1]MBE7638243.1 hypothetical protein [Sneathiella sp. P13V-1]
MSQIPSIINEQHHIEITYFDNRPPEVVHRAAAVPDNELTVEEFEEAMSFCMKHGQRLEIRAGLSNEKIIELVDELDGQGPILVSSIRNFTIEAPRPLSPDNSTSDKE